MRIISNFSDYYDGVQRYGIDAAITYIRRTKIFNFGDRIVFPTFTPPRPTDTQGDFRSWYYTEETIMFDDKNHGGNCIIRIIPVSVCGQLHIRYYGTAEMPNSLYDSNASGVEIPPNIKHCFGNSYDEVKEAMMSAFNLVPNHTPRYARTVPSDVVAGLKSLNLEELHYKLNSPIFAIIRSASTYTSYADKTQPISFVRDCCLADVKFQQVCDPYTIFNQLASYIGGVLATRPKTTIALSDKDVLLKHGFDAKISFRHRV